MYLIIRNPAAEFSIPTGNSLEQQDVLVDGMKEFFKDFYLDEVTHLEIEKLKAVKLKQDARTSTVNRYLALLSKMLNLALEWEVLRRNQIFRIKRFSEKDNLQEDYSG